MAALYPVAGCKISIGGPMTPQSDPFVAADFTGETWVPIGGWTTMGGFGDTAQLITSDVIDEGRTKKLKGTRNAGSMANVFNNDPLDEGQIALAAAEETLLNYAFKVELNDNDGGTGATNSIRYFIGLVMSAADAGGGANTPQSFNATVEINSNVVKVPAVAGT